MMEMSDGNNEIEEGMQVNVVRKLYYIKVDDEKREYFKSEVFG